MERREKLLLGALLAVFCVFAVDQGYTRFYTKPIQAAEQQIEKLDEELHQNQLNLILQKKRLPMLDELKPMSLPSDIELATTEYRSWLLESLSQSGLAQPNLDSGSPSFFQGLYYRLSFSVSTRGTVSQLTDFLHQFYGTQYLHKIRSISLNPSATGEVGVQLAIEVLGVPAVNPAESLPTQTIDPEWQATAERFKLIAQRNIFRAGPPPGRSIELAAITRDRQRQRQAWLKFHETGETKIVNSGDKLSIDGTQIEFVEIEADSLAFVIDGDRRTINIGRRLAE